MIGNVGDDHFGAEYLALLKNEHIDTSSIGIVEQTKTGIANIIVEADGTNRIMIAGNANHAFSLTKDASWDLVTDSVDITIFQLEIPLAVVCVAWRCAYHSAESETGPAQSEALSGQTTARHTQPSSSCTTS